MEEQNMKDVITRLHSILSDLKKCDSVERVDSLIASAISLLETGGYSKTNAHIIKLENIREKLPKYEADLRNWYSIDPDMHYSIQSDPERIGIDIIEDIIENIKAVGLPGNKKDSSTFNITNTLTQSQQQEQSQQLIVEIFMEAIKDELTGKQQKEIKAILEEEKDIAKAKPKLIDKLKGFGENVLSNIVANIITNPKAWEEFAKVW
ncbi:hypothetical protein [uncultured Bacteroides sp.]|uniref:hypothetical protein n=1 Tax=uncultured Bacteroides sp. TaxID=162156 RepID=UPI002AAAA95C|nr:hypothetical protein [uncultured Bacteroides sp.]